MTLLAEKLPEFDHRLSQSVFVPAPPAVVFRAIHEVRLSEMPLAMFMNRVRYAFQKRADTFEDQPYLEANWRGGWVPLGEVPDREVAAGLVGKFWKGDSAIDRLTTEQFASEPPPDRVKIAIDYELAPLAGGTRLTAETRIRDPREKSAARRFHVYYALIRLGIPIVVGSGLRAIKRHAERAQA
jgi:hypothetical protein